MLADALTWERSGRSDPEMAEDEDFDGKASPLVQLRITQAVTNQKVEQLVNAINELRGEVRELKSNFTTKSEFRALEEEVKGLKNNQGWIVKIIVGAVVTAMLGLVLVKGGIGSP